MLTARRCFSPHTERRAVPNLTFSGLRCRSCNLSLIAPSLGLRYGYAFRIPAPPPRPVVQVRHEHRTAALIRFRLRLGELDLGALLSGLDLLPRLKP